MLTDNRNFCSGAMNLSSRGLNVRTAALNCQPTQSCTDLYMSRRHHHIVTHRHTRTSSNRNKKLSRCWDSATCAPLMPPKCKTPHFPHPCTRLPQHNSESQDITIWIDFITQVAKIPIYPFMYTNFHLLLHYVIIIHQQYRQMGRRTSCS